MRNRRPYLGQGGIWDYPSEGFERGRPPTPPKTERRLTKSGPFEYVPPEEEVDPKIDRLVWNWVKKNPYNMVDILTGMYGLAGRDAERQTAVRNALDAARSLEPFFSERKQADEIGRKIQDFPPDEENYRSFRQALLNALPNLIEAARKKKEHEKADGLIYLADQIYTL